MYSILVEKAGFSEDFEEFDKAVLGYFRKSVRLIPFYGHRCFFEGMDHMPIVSFRQPTDVIFYGGTFWNYLEHEFLKGECVVENVHERMENSGIWSDVIWQAPSVEKWIWMKTHAFGCAFFHMCAGRIYSLS